MLFVPSIGGISHHHAENTKDEDIVLGCQVFADAAAAGRAPFSFSRLRPERDRSFTSHAMSPSAVLAVYRQVFAQEPPDAYLLAIRGESFELGESMSAAAERNLEAALELATRLLDTPTAADQLRGEG